MIGGAGPGGLSRGALRRHLCFGAGSFIIVTRGHVLCASNRASSSSPLLPFPINHGGPDWKPTSCSLAGRGDHGAIIMRQIRIMHDAARIKL